MQFSFFFVSQPGGFAVVHWLGENPDYSEQGEMTKIYKRKHTQKQHTTHLPNYPPRAGTASAKKNLY